MCASAHKYVASERVKKEWSPRENIRGRAARKWRKRVTLCGFWRVCVDVNHLCFDACLARARHGSGAASERLRRTSIAWQAQHFRKLKYRFRGRRSTVAQNTRARGQPEDSLYRCGLHCVEAALWPSAKFDFDSARSMKQATKLSSTTLTRLVAIVHTVDELCL